MPYRLTASDKDLTRALRRIARQQIDRAIAAIDAETGETLAETIHDVRKRAKKLRGLLRLVRPALPAYAKENATLRDAARRLSALRDRGALIEAYDRLLDHYADDTARAPFASLRGALTRDQNQIAADPATFDELSRFRDRLLRVRDRTAAWRLTEKDRRAIALGVAKTYGRAVIASGAAGHAPDAAALHEWRKRAKYHRYHVSLMAPVWPAELENRLVLVKRLEDILGEHRDLTLLSAAASDMSRPLDISARATFTGFAERRQAEIIAEAGPLSGRLFAESPEALTDRWTAWHKLWRRETA
ncbi:hypothetical protein ATO6_01025 [Oceanicola sp. 22II-s10i]|nr:CHAD domain-containing protein [Oceanicola sp. 22II-s10i]OWU85556.1 hypothetical protein ATO6_01025 [Oceanicola sp. 22II-s10i]